MLVRDLVALDIDESKGVLEEGAETWSTYHFKCLLIKALYILLAMMNKKKIWSILIKIEKYNSNLHTYDMGKILYYWTQPKVKKKKNLFKKEIDIEVKVFQDLSYP